MVARPLTPSALPVPGREEVFFTQGQLTLQIMVRRYYLGIGRMPMADCDPDLRASYVSEPV